jgi:hypothetical protein
MVQVIVEYLKLWDVLENVALRPQVEDRFVWRFGAEGLYSASSAYIQGHVHRLLDAVGEQKSSQRPPRVKFFF